MSHSGMLIQICLPLWLLLIMQECHLWWLKHCACCAPCLPCYECKTSCREQVTHLANATGVWTSAAGQKYLAGCQHLFMLSGCSLITYLEVLFWSRLKTVFPVDAVSNPWLCGCNSFPSVAQKGMWAHSCPKALPNKRKGDRSGCYGMLIIPNLGESNLFSDPCILTLVCRYSLLVLGFWTAL